MADLREFELIIKRIFIRPELLQTALTHRSFINETEQKAPDNERLEFLGDAVLDYMSGDMLYMKYPHFSEGELTQLRAALVRADSLAILASEIRLGEFIAMGKGEESTGGRTRTNILCDTFEAVLGAIYLDGGMDAAKQFMVPRLEKLLDFILLHQLHRDARSILQERAQAELHITPSYRVAQTSGKEHEREYILEVMIGTVVIGSGVGNSKRVAAQTAARNALQRLETIGWLPEAVEYASQLGLLDPLSESQSPQTPTDDQTLRSP